MNNINCKEFPSNIITINDIDVINKLFSEYKTARIFGKGPTFKNISKEGDESVLHIAINQTANFLDECDVLVCNDIEPTLEIENRVYKNLKLIIIPEYPQKNCAFNKKVTWYILYKK